MAGEGHFIVGTAGHVDHGKTALIGALTGTETDRLKEEKKRGISIELGFARLDLGNGLIAGVVDVPGHEKFIPQMLSGIAGIDLVLLVVDANEGVMPQTREHLQIMELLQVGRGILILSKCDLVEPDWLDIVEEEIREQVAGTFLDNAPCCRVSALTGEGLDELRSTIRTQLKQVPAREVTGAVRLPIDRCFSISGFGTVVTGTLNSGQIRQGDTLELLPAGVETRVREVQVHGRQAEEGQAGQRVALNLSGVSRDQVPHGSVVGSSGLFRASQRIDVRLKLLKDAPRPVKFRDQLHFHLGTARTVARAVLLDRDELTPGEEAFVQLTFDNPLLSHRGDRFIVRSYSPMLTIGGGVVIDVEPIKHRRFRPEVIKRLDELSSGNLGFWLQKLDELGIARIKDLEKHTGTSREELRQGLEKLAEMGQVETLGDQWVVNERVRSWLQQLPQLVADYQQANHLRHGIPRATLQVKVAEKLAPKGFEELLQRIVASGSLSVAGDLVMTPGWQPSLTDKEMEIFNIIEQHFLQHGFQVKNQNEIISQLGLEGIDADLYFSYLVLEKKLVRLNPDSYLHSDYFQQALQHLKDLFEQQASFTLAQFRDLTGSNRKLTQALLEYFDGCKYTRRTGEERVVWNLPDR